MVEGIRRRGTAIFRRIVLLLDQLAPQGGAFGQALEWVQRLHVPMLGISLPCWGFGRTAEYSELEQACAGACTARKIPWELIKWERFSAEGLVQIAGSEDLFVFGHGIPPAQKEQLLRDALRRDAPATLICADEWISSSRVLVLDNARHQDESFLRKAAQICARLQLSPVVLSVAGLERAAKDRQQRAFNILAGCNVKADFDYFVGCEVRFGVAQIARWRRCQTVVAQHEARAPWWRWLRDTTVEELMGVLKSFSFLALPKVRCLNGLSEKMDAVSGAPASACEPPFCSRINGEEDLASGRVGTLRSTGES